jgi:hypothetical protein
MVKEVEVPNPKHQITNKFQINIFEISPHPFPLPSGERAGVREQNVRRIFSNSNM